jgi:hypothetical protein
MEDPKEENVCIMNLCQARLGTAYPNSIGNTGLVSMIKTYYHFEQCEPPLKDFNTYTKEDDDNKRRVFGPYVVRGPSRSATRAMAIQQFLVTEMLVDAAAVADPNETARIDSYEHGTRHVHFVGWILDTDRVAEHLQTKMHAAVSEVYRSQFALVASYPREEKWCVCTHALRGPASSPGASVSELREDAIARHAIECLRKRYVPTAQPALTAAEEKWLTLGGPEGLKTDRATILPPEVWAKEHPYFKHCTYGANKVIKLTAAEVKKLPKDLAKAWKQVLDRTVEKETWERFHTWVAKCVETMYRDFAVRGLDLSQLALCNQWTFYEMIKVCVSPPAPVSKSRACPVPGFEPQRQAFAIALGSNMYCVAKPRGSLDEVALIINLAVGGLTLRQMVDVAKAPMDVHEPGASAGPIAGHPLQQQVGVVRGLAHIEQVFNTIAKICVVPVETLQTGPPKEDDAAYSAWTLSSPQNAPAGLMGL